jgi:hypothetical protein
LSLNSALIAPLWHKKTKQKFGAKDALAKIAPLRTGLPDTHAYYDAGKALLRLYYLCLRLY